MQFYYQKKNHVSRTKTVSIRWKRRTGDIFLAQESQLAAVINICERCFQTFGTILSPLRRCRRRRSHMGDYFSSGLENQSSDSGKRQKIYLVKNDAVERKRANDDAIRCICLNYQKVKSFYLLKIIFEVVCVAPLEAEVSLNGL